MRRAGWAGVVVVACIAAAPSLRAQTTYPPGEPLLGSDPMNGWRLTSANAAAAQVEVTGQSFPRAWRLETRVDSSPSYAIEFKVPIARAVSRGDVALLRFFARAVATTDESGAAYLRLVVQKASPQWDKSIEGLHTVTREWQEFFVPFVFGADYAAGASEVAFGVGFKRQTVELGGFDFVYYGRGVPFGDLPRTRPSYLGREPGAAWRVAALARIEQVRKSDFVISVVDEAGRPVSGATVRVQQQRQAFQFGSALQMARLVQDTPVNRRYRQKVLELFNAGGPENDLKWPPWDGEWGSGYNQPQTIAGLTWLKNHGLHVRGHVLVWPGWNNLPASIRALRGTAQQNEIPARALAHIADVVARTRDVIDEWDVLNEPYSNHDLMDLFGAQIQVDWFNAARAAHPTATLVLNDYSNHDASLDAAHVAAFETTARYLRAQGAPLGALGLQAHISSNPSPPANVVAVLDRYAALGLPIRITEFDINTDDEQLQADYTRDFLTAVFSHPTVVGFQMWGFWEGAHWIPRGAMYRTDFSEKPNARAYKALVLDEWRTRATGSTDVRGEWRGRGFHGDYVVTVEYGGRTFEQVFSLRPATTAQSVRVQLVPARLVNLSTRAAAGAGEATLIPGFVIAGSTPTRVLVRGVGPGLGAFGIRGALARPELTLHRADSSVVAVNRGWDAGPDAGAIARESERLGAFALVANSRDCAMLVTLPPGAYTAPVASLDEQAGVALVEVYAVDPGNGSRFRNFSARAIVGNGEGIAIPGLVIAGPTARTVLVRAMGPGLAAYGVAGSLRRPELVVRSGQQSVAANAGWESSADPAALVAGAQRAGAFPFTPGQPDAAVIATLPAGDWTLQVAGADGGAGVVLIEVYDLSG